MVVISASRSSSLAVALLMIVYFADKYGSPEISELMIQSIRLRIPHAPSVILFLRQYELLVLTDAALHDAESISTFLSDWECFSADLTDAMREMYSILKEENDHA